METKYGVIFTHKEQFHRLENDWRRLETGKDMTYFQLYDWYKMLIGLQQKDNWAHEIVFCSVIDGYGNTIMIAPLWIVKKFFGKREKKGVYLFGRRGWNDYCNFIYNSFCGEALMALFKAIKKNYNISRYVFENLIVNTSLYNFLRDKYTLINVKKQINVAVNLPEDKDSYLKLLSKHSKQNIRTAQNRALKDGIEYVIIEDDTSMSVEEFQHYREIRVDKKNKLTHGNLWHQIRNRLSLIVRYRFPKYTPMENDKNCHYLSCRTISKELMGAFCYGIDLYRKEIFIMAVSLNIKYQRYSPCILAAYQYIVSHLEDPEIRAVNFTRGNEKYKYVLGGTNHYSNSFEIDYV